MEVVRPRRSTIEGHAEHRDFVVARARSHDIPRSFHREDVAPGNKDLAEWTGLGISTVLRFTHTLHRLGYLSEATDTAHCRLATHVLSLGLSYLVGTGTWEITKPLVQNLPIEAIRL